MKNNYKRNILIIFLLFMINSTYGLYEDQIGKFDWRKLHIGKVREGFFDPNTKNGAFVITEENVLASLNIHSSELKWRQIFENNPRGSIKLFHIVSDDDNEDTHIATTNRNTNYAYDILTVSGISPAIVRGWSGITGNLQFEWSIMPLQNDKAIDSIWYYENFYLYHIIPVWNSHLEITKYFANNGQIDGHTSTKIPASWINKNNCIQSNSYFVCLDKNQLISLDFVEDEVKIHRRTLSFEVNSVPKTLKGRKGYIVLNNKVISLNEESKNCPQAEASTILYAQLQNEEVYVMGDVKDDIFHVSVLNADTCEKIQNMQFDIKYPKYYGQPQIIAFKCEQGKICNMLVSAEDGALLFIQQNKIKLAREESLSDIAAVELIDLPLTDAEGDMESEFNSKPGDITGAFVRRITAQTNQLKNAILHILGLALHPTHKQKQKSSLVRDAFGLHKMIVILTKSGKLYGIDNLTGEQHWIQYLPSIENFNKNENMRLIIQRTSRHFPFESICAVVAKDKVTGNGVLFQFNPITGQSIANGLKRLQYKIKQLAILHENEDDFIKGLLLLDSNNNVHVIPESAQEKAIGMFLYTANKENATLEGYHVYRKADNKLDALPIWKINLGGQLNNHKITTIAAKNPNEHVHSQGRVLSDRSVLYKYINPNLIAVVTQAPDSIHKYIMNVHLIDVVSGSIVFSMTHRKVRGPLHIVHSENWLVYSYYNDKVRRHEITTVELYEGKIQANSTVWSSLDAPPLPLVEKQSYIFPGIIETMKETITERGITNKHILIGLSSGGVLEMPWAFLDPRRPVSNQQREEGSIPYIPELPIPTENIINYNQSIAKIRNIYTAPSGLESTCLVVAYGLDLFVTRVSPSKTFDLLKEDFDYFLITVVLLALTIGSFVTKHLSSRKALKQAWK